MTDIKTTPPVCVLTFTPSYSFPEDTILLICLLTHYLSPLSEGMLLASEGVVPLEWMATAGIQEQHRLYHPTQALCRTYSCAQEPWGAVHWKRPAASPFPASERKVAPLYKRAFLHAHEAVLINEDIICLLRHLELILTGSLPCPLVLSPPLQRETISLKAKLMQICWLAQHFGKSN